LDGQIMIMAPIGENHGAVVDALAEILIDQTESEVPCRGPTPPPNRR
jgi:hypothetical protein